MTLGTNDVQELRQAWERLPRPKSKWIAAVEVALDVVQEHVPPEVRLGAVGEAFKRWSDDRRIHAAAWRWLKPQSEPELHDRLPDLQRRVGLLHLPHDEFCRRLIRACQELTENLSELAMHTATRIAEAEFRLLRSERAVEVGEGFHVGVLQLVAAADQHRTNPSAARDAAAGLVQAALASVCRQVAETLGPDGTNRPVMNANLMVPVLFSDTDPYPHAFASRTRSGRLAATVWEGYARWPLHQALMVIAETAQGPGFTGFWIPDIRWDGRVLPGAVRAFVSGDVQKLISQDLPAFPIPDDAIKLRWLDYMRGDAPGTFTFDVCVSIPVFSRHALHGVDQPVAVINVNAVTNGLWPRVLSRSWRRLLRQRVEAWVSVMWAAAGVVYAVDHCTLASADGWPLPLFPPDVGDLVTAGLENAGPVVMHRLTSGVSQGEPDDHD